jgi:hypothetical protein
MRPAGMSRAAANFQSSKSTPWRAADAWVICLDEPWCNRVCRYTELAQLECQALGEADYACLGGGVVDLAPVTKR